METFSLLLLLVFSDSAATQDKSEISVLDTGLTRQECIVRVPSNPFTSIVSDTYLSVSSKVYCEPEPIK